MKLLIVLSLLAYGYADKLDRTYLPPPGAATAGGSPGSLTAPGQGFGQQTSAFRGSQSQGRGPFDSAGPSQSGPSGFGQAPSQPLGGTGAAVFGRPSGPSQSAASGFGGNGAFGRPSGQTGFPSGTGVQPPSNQFGQAGQAQGFAQQPERPQASADRNAEILRYDNQNDGETFSYNFETSNGIAAEESGVATNGVQAQGGYSYTGDDGQFYKITYTADENGYVPQGDHLPTPPPIPDEILRSIEENQRAAAAGNQEGAYNPDEDNSPQYNAPTFNQGQGQFRGSNGFGPSGSAGQSGSQGAGFNQGSSQGQGFNQGSTQGQGFNQGSTQGQGFNQGSSQGQGFNQGSQTAFNGNQGQRGQGQAGQGQSGYEYSRPQSQGRQPSGPNAIPSGPSKAPGQNQRAFHGQNQPSSGPVGNQRQYLAPEDNQRKPGSQTSQSYNQGSQSSRPRQGPSQFNKNQFGSGSRPSRPNFGQNRPTQQQQPQGFPAQKGPQGSQGPQGFPAQIGPQGPQGPQGFPAQRGSQGPHGPQGFPAQRGSQAQGSNAQNQDGYEYNRPQSTFNSGNQAQSRPQGPSGSRPQSAFPGSSAQGQPGFPGSQSQTGFPGSQSQTGFPGSSRPAGQPQATPQFPGPRGQQPQRPSQQETFGGPRQPPSFSPEEGYKY